MGDGGPFYAHVVNGVWIKSSPLVPNLPVSANAYYGRNRNYAADRIRYPMIRADFNPSGSRNQQNRGKSGFVRITWDEALTIIANESTRVKKYLRSWRSPCYSHRSPMGQVDLHNSSGAPIMSYAPTASGGGWGSRFWSLFGGCSIMYGGSSNPGNQAAGPLAMGMTASTSTNNIGDILANSKMVIHWGVDTAVRSYAGNRQNLYLKQFQQAGIKQVVIDSFYNDTAALFGAQWIPIVPNTDEALLAAIAYVWFTNNLISDSFAAAHVYGYSSVQELRSRKHRRYPQDTSVGFGYYYSANGDHHTARTELGVDENLRNARFRQCGRVRRRNQQKDKRHPGTSNDNRNVRYLWQSRSFWRRPRWMELHNDWHRSEEFWRSNKHDG